MYERWRDPAPTARIVARTTLDGLVTVLRAPPLAVERETLRLVRAHGLRAMDAWHLATATLTVPPLIEPGERMAFASRDGRRRDVAEELGFTAL